jgi:putative endonuclease
MNRAGARAEELCAELLRKAGLRVLARNWRCRHGEIDLVAEEGTTLVFAEVRYRRDERYGGAAESGYRPPSRRAWSRRRACTSCGRPDADCSFDVLLLDSPRSGRIKWIRNAFAA